ncbi:hypothetical protein SAY87_031342 [Trapa incisa]|uniref:HMA domain-containing protein n=2 Tax=Trapa TaxID=22665 RepID=A0AAN7LVC3_TRANT|nr:hypothetical protein SAY87_031342 [Trapa incisa]KAK4787253.1 hypothetical protein SAY86_011086 [Trapa natans]
MSTIVEMQVNIDCPGCESKIRRTLRKLDGVDEVEIDMAMQKVTVVGWADQETVLGAVRKTWRRAELWPFPYDPECHSFAREYHHYDHGRNHYQADHIEPSLSVVDGHYSNDIYDDGLLEDDNYYHRTLNDDPAAYTAPSPAFSYNYYRHGYEGREYGYYLQPPYSTIVDQQASSLFSDDNANACTIM